MNISQRAKCIEKYNASKIRDNSPPDEEESVLNGVPGLTHIIKSTESIPVEENEDNKLNLISNKGFSKPNFSSKLVISFFK